MLLIDTFCFYTSTAPFNRNFENFLELCLNPMQQPPNFCTSQNVPKDFVRYRTINGTCNNLDSGKATFGAAGIVSARFLPESVYLNLQLFMQKEFSVSYFCLNFVKLFEIAVLRITSKNCR